VILFTLLLFVSLRSRVLRLLLLVLLLPCCDALLRCEFCCCCCVAMPVVFIALFCYRRVLLRCIVVDAVVLLPLVIVTLFVTLLLVVVDVVVVVTVPVADSVHVRFVAICLLFPWCCCCCWLLFCYALLVLRFPMFCCRYLLPLRLLYVGGTMVLMPLRVAVCSCHCMLLRCCW